MSMSNPVTLPQRIPIPQFPLPLPNHLAIWVESIGILDHPMIPFSLFSLGRLGFLDAGIIGSGSNPALNKGIAPLSNVICSVIDTSFKNIQTCSLANVHNLFAAYLLGYCAYHDHKGSHSSHPWCNTHTWSLCFLQIL